MADAGKVDGDDVEVVGEQRHAPGPRPRRCPASRAPTRGSARRRLPSVVVHRQGRRAHRIIPARRSRRRRRCDRATRLRCDDVRGARRYARASREEEQGEVRWPRREASNEGRQEEVQEEGRQEVLEEEERQEEVQEEQEEVTPTARRSPRTGRGIDGSWRVGCRSGRNEWSSGPANASGRARRRTNPGQGRPGLVPVRLAEGGGFDPPGPVKARRFSRPVHSSALPSFRRPSYASCRTARNPSATAAMDRQKLE